MSLRLLHFLYRETEGKFGIVGASLGSGLSRGLLLATFNAAAAAGLRGSGGTGVWALGFAGALLFYLSSTYLSIRAAQRSVALMIERLRVRLCAKLLLTQLHFLEATGSGDLYTQLSSDLDRISSAAITLLGAFQAIVLLIFALIYLAWLSPIAFAVTLAMIVVGVSVHLLQEREARRSLMKARERQTAFFDIISDLLHGFKELKLTRARRDGLMGHLTEVAGDYREFTIKAETLFLVSLLTSQTFTFGLIAVLVFGIPAVFPTQGSVIFQFLSTILFLIGPVETLVSSVPSIVRARVALTSVEKLESQLDTGIAAEAPRLAAPADFRRIEFRGVHYRFQGSEPEDKFDVGPIDLDISQGEIVFFVGGNGAGKTTFLKLLSGLYPPASGTIEVDGRPVAHADRQTYREMFGAVFGDFHLFRRLYGVEAPDPERAAALLSELQLDAKTKLRNGELTAIHLSSGQRKRLAYAVTRFLDRPIFVFDEFAADQDPAFRRYFYTGLLPQLRAAGKTVVVVTHDERWFALADRVVKMEYGRIAEIVVHDGARADAPTL